MSKPDDHKLPKKVAGIRLPKLLRKSDLIETLMAHPDGRKLLSDALLAAAAAVSEVILNHDPAATSPDGAGEGSTAADAASRPKRRRRRVERSESDTPDDAGASSGTREPGVKAQQKRRTRGRPSNAETA